MWQSYSEIVSATVLNVSNMSFLSMQLYNMKVDIANGAF